MILKAKEVEKEGGCARGERRRDSEESAGPWGDICVCTSIRDQLTKVT